MEISGKIHLLSETESIGANDFKKRQIVIETEEEYSRKIPIDFVQEKTVLLDGLQEGQNVKVSFNLKGSESNGKHFLSANGWKVKLFEGGESTVFNIDFGGHVMAGLKIVNGEIEVVGSMNGYGNGISTDEIRITKSNQ